MAEDGPPPPTLYVPAAFDGDPVSAARIMREHSFAVLITPCGNGTRITHLPLIWSSCPGSHGTLYGHVARANPHWRAWGDASAATTAVFTGPHAYISPAWFGTQGHVPTWNYVAVHATGRARAATDAAETRAILDAMVAVYEPGAGQPDRLPLADEAIVQLQRGIVAFDLTIERIEVKLKLGQNRTEEERSSVIEILSRSESAAERELAAWMADPGSDVD